MYWPGCVIKCEENFTTTLFLSLRCGYGTYNNANNKRVPTSLCKKCVVNQLPSTCLTWEFLCKTVYTRVYVGQVTLKFQRVYIMNRVSVVCAVNRLRTWCFGVTSTIVFSETAGTALPPSQPTVRYVIRVFAGGKSGNVVKLITHHHLTKGQANPLQAWTDP